MYFKVILTKDYFLKDHFSLSFYSSLFFSSFFLWFSNSLSSFFSVFVLFLLILFFNGVSSTSLETLISQIYLPASGIWPPIVLREYLFFVFAPQCRGDPWSGCWKKKKLSGSKRRLSNNFFTSVKEWWKMTIFHLKHNYLDWRAIPCRRGMICVYAVFHHFSQHIFFASWFLFWFNRNFQVHDMTINFFLFFEWSTMGNVTCRGWPSSLKHLFSYEDRFERVAFWSKVIYIIYVKREDCGSKVFQRNGQFWSTCPKASIKVISEYHDLRDLCFWVIGRVLAGLKL